MALSVAERRLRDREKRRKWRAANEAHSRSYQKAYHAAHKDHKNNNRLLKKYGITTEQRDALLAAQNFRCAVCATDTPGGRGTWHVDHCHTSGRVRGLLCCQCNRGLGQFKDNPALLLNAANYLKKSA